MFAAFGIRKPYMLNRLFNKLLQWFHIKVSVLHDRAWDNLLFMWDLSSLQRWLLRLFSSTYRHYVPKRLWVTTILHGVTCNISIFWILTSVTTLNFDNELHFEKSNTVDILRYGFIYFPPEINEAGTGEK